MNQLLDGFKKNKEKIATILFFAGFAIEVLMMMAGHSAFEFPFRGRLLHVAFVLFGLKVLLTKYTKTEWLVIAALGVAGTLSYFSMGEEWFLRVVMMIIASKGISLKDVIKYTFWVSLVGSLFIAVLSIAGVGGMLVDIRDYGRGEVEARYCFGFNHANNVHGTLWYIVCLGILAYLKKYRWYHGVLLTVINFALYHFTISRTGLAVTEAVIVAALIYVYYPKIAGWKWIYAAGGLGTAFCAFIGIFVTAAGVFTVPGLKWLSDMLTVRLECLSWWESIDQWSLFGDGRERRATDVGFITLVSEYGYVIFGIYLLVLFLMIFYYCRNKKWTEFIVLMTCVLYTFMESTYVFNVYVLCNFTFLLLMGTWNRLLKKEEVQEQV